VWSFPGVFAYEFWYAVEAIQEAPQLFPDDMVWVMYLSVVFVVALLSLQYVALFLYSWRSRRLWEA
jgi:hypothetical protein